MRQRKAKNMEARIAALSHLLVQEPFAWKGNWAQAVPSEGELYLEVGCGKGKFLTECASSKGDAGYIGMEGQDSVLLRALEKAEQAQIGNIRFVHMFLQDIRDVFQDGELTGIYLNFSDPWPKARHAKRRLTHGERLLQYKQVLRPDGFISIKTDNDALFGFTLEEIERMNLEVKEQAWNLHDSNYAARETTTEYEERFRSAGKDIHYVLL